MKPLDCFAVRPAARAALGSQWLQKSLYAELDTSWQYDYIPIT